MFDSPEHDRLVDELQLKIMTLHSSIWERRGDWPQVLSWLEQFEENSDPLSDEQLHALRLLSNFMYFGVSEIRAILRSLYRDTFRPEVAKGVRAKLGAAADHASIGLQIDNELRQTRFVSLGNPSESSALLLYYFRQENMLHKDLFIHSSDIFDLSNVGSGGSVGLTNGSIRHYVFIDDLCGSGHQGEQYSKNIVTLLKKIDPSVMTYYFPLFGLTDGIDHIQKNSHFDIVYPVVELDNSFKAFSPDSRLFADPTLANLRTAIENTCRRYGSQLWPDFPLGYEDSQLYISFAHNTPDNTLPIFWCDHTASISWLPIFKRYPKVFW